MYSSFAEVYDCIFPVSASALDLILGYVNSKTRILELGCGTGALLKELKALRKVGLDIEPALIAKAQKKICFEPPEQSSFAQINAELDNAEFICAELMDFGPSQPAAAFDLIFSLGNVVSHLEPQQFKNWLENIHRLLVPGGYWIFHIIHWDDILKFTDYSYPPLKRGDYIFNRNYSDISAQSLNFKTRLTQGEALVFEQKQILYPHSSAFLNQIHHGFKNLEIWADYAKNPPAGISRVLVMQRQP